MYAIYKSINGITPAYKLRSLQREQTTAYNLGRLKVRFTQCKNNATQVWETLTDSILTSETLVALFKRGTAV